MWCMGSSTFSDKIHEHRVLSECEALLLRRNSCFVTLWAFENQVPKARIRGREIDGHTCSDGEGWEEAALKVGEV